MQRNQPEKVDFIDISLAGYDGAKYKDVSYEMAMEEMHVIDEKDEVNLHTTDFTRTVILCMLNYHFDKCSIMWHYTVPVG